MLSRSLFAQRKNRTATTIPDYVVLNSGITSSCWFCEPLQCTTGRCKVPAESQRPASSSVYHHQRV